MIGVDTNVLVRHLLDEPEDPQKKAVDRFMEDSLGRGEVLYVGHIVLCEVVWVLTSCYRFSRQEIAAVLERVLAATEFEIQDKQRVWESLAEFRRSGANFADCLIGSSNHAAGCSTTATFDRKAGKLETYRLL